MLIHLTGHEKLNWVIREHGKMTGTKLEKECMALAALITHSGTVTTCFIH